MSGHRPRRGTSPARRPPAASSRARADGSPARSARRRSALAPRPASGYLNDFPYRHRSRPRVTGNRATRRGPETDRWVDAIMIAVVGERNRDGRLLRVGTLVLLGVAVLFRWFARERAGKPREVGTADPAPVRDVAAADRLGQQPLGADAL